MKKSIFLLLLFFTLSQTCILAQQSSNAGNYGRTLNLGLGIGYYGYLGQSTPVLHANYELYVAKDFTLAPFITFFTHRSHYYDNNPNKDRYYYHETVIPIGVKGSYYFDELLRANPKWDFYLAGSLGFSIINSYWDNGYTGDRSVYHGARPLYLDFHIGTEYHFNNRIGAFLDLSSGVSTIGLAIHN